MNYRHIYHAGCFADVIKHVVLLSLIHSMQKKEKSFSYIDTHAGIGDYPLDCVAAKTSQEYMEGITLLQKELDQHAPQFVKQLVGQFTKSAPFYYGSAKIAYLEKRPQDHLILNELHPEDYALLKYCFKNSDQVAIHHRDAYEFLPAVLPPPSRRGLVLLDPAFERENEFEQLVLVLEKALARFETGTYAVWFPIKDEHYRNFYRKMRGICQKPMLALEFSQTQIVNTERMQACGMLIINPPYQISQVLTKELEYLQKKMAPDGFYRLLSIVGNTI